MNREPEVIVTRRSRFSASHRLHNPDFSEEKNRETFGKCNNPHGHGHNYELEVMVKGTPDPDTGYVIDLKELEDIVRDRVIEHVDHKHLNEQVDFLDGINPTVENLASVFYHRLAPALENGRRRLHGVRLYESENNWCEYYGDKRSDPNSSSVDKLAAALEHHHHHH